MKLEEVLPAFRAGKKIRDISWSKGLFLHKDETTNFYSVGINSEWEIVEDEKPLPVKTKTVWQWRVREKKTIHSDDHGVASYFQPSRDWIVMDRLLSEDEVSSKISITCEYEKHSGPFEVPE